MGPVESGGRDRSSIRYPSLIIDVTKESEVIPGQSPKVELPLVVVVWGTAHRQTLGLMHPAIAAFGFPLPLPLNGFRGGKLVLSSLVRPWVFKV